MEEVKFVRLVTDEKFLAKVSLEDGVYTFNKPVEMVIAQDKARK